MVSFNVTALFTSIDLELVQKIDGSRIHNMPNLAKCTSIKIPRINLCLIIYFQFEGQIYQQIRGTPKGSALSGLIAETMQHLETGTSPHTQKNMDLLCRQHHRNKGITRRYMK